MKKRIAWILLAAAVLMLAACGHKNEPAPTAAETEQVQETQAAEPETQATVPVPKPVCAGVYRKPWREEIAGKVVEGYSYIVLKEDHTGYWVAQAVATLTWDETQLKTTVGEVCNIELTQDNAAIKLLVYPDPRSSTAQTPDVYEKIEKLPAEIEAMIAEDSVQPCSELDYPGTYCRTWTEEIGGTIAQRHSYYLLNADHTGYVIAQAVGSLTWDKDHVTDNLGLTYRIAVNRKNEAVNLLVYESQGDPAVYQKIDKLPADVEAMLAEATAPRVSVPEITKSPTTETVTEGEEAYFVAHANNYNYIDWYIVKADHSYRMPAASASRNFPGLSVSGEGTTALLLSNIPLSMDGWCVEAVFTGNGGSATTNHCYINVNPAVKEPLYAVPSSGIYVTDQPVQLNAAPNATIYYELYDDVGNVQTGTVQSGEYVYIPAIANVRYIARLVAYVVDDETNLTVCEYTMDCLPEPDVPTEPPVPSFNGGHFYNNNDAEVDFAPIGDGGFTASVGIIRVVSFDGTASYHDGVLYMDLRDPSGNFVGATFDVESGTLDISTSTWEDVPAGSVFYGLH